MFFFIYLSVVVVSLRTQCMLPSTLLMVLVVVVVVDGEDDDDTGELLLVFQTGVNKAMRSRNQGPKLSLTKLLSRVMF